MALCAITGLVRCAAAQSLTVSPRDTAIDVSVAVLITGLEPQQQVRVRAVRTERPGRQWQSIAWFHADGRGMIDLVRDAPDSGSYRGVQPMGLVVSMDLLGGVPGSERFSWKWTDTMRTEIVAESRGRRLGIDTLTQWFAGEGVRSLPVRDSGLVGTLFVPAHASGPLPGILVLGGSEGGLSSEDVAAVLASHGTAALALAYFGTESLPAQLDRIPLEYFSRAVSFLRAQTGVGRIGVLGTSKGAEAALLVAARDSRISAVVAYAPSSVAWSCICDETENASWTANGVAVASIPPGRDPDYHPAPGTPLQPAINYRYRYRDPAVRRGAEIPVEKIAGPLLLVAGDDDHLWPSLEMARAVYQRRRDAGVGAHDELLEYSGAGHLIGKGFLPAGSVLIAGGRLDTGGSGAANAAAQRDAWPRAVRFLLAALTQR